MNIEVFREKFKSVSKLSSTISITVKVGSKRKTINKRIRVPFSEFCLATTFMGNPVANKIGKKITLESLIGVTEKKLLMD